MQEVQEKVFPGEQGLRARKRLETHARIQAEGLRLFTEKGFDGATLDEVAAAAGVSRRTLLNYFGSKEEIVFSLKAQIPEMIAQAVAARPCDEPLLDMVEGGLADVAARFQTPDMLDLTRLIHQTPALQAGDHAKYEGVERLLAQTLAERKGLAPDDVACRVAAAIGVSIMKLAGEAWLAHPDEGPERFGREAFAVLRRMAGQRPPP